MLNLPVTSPQLGPYSESIDYQLMRDRWELPYDLYGGTLTMRTRNKKWLPQEMRESDEAYKNRLNRTFLYNAFKRTIKAYVGVAFLKNVTVNGLPEELEYLITDCDGTGRSLTAFTADLTEDMLISGKGHIFVDNPVITGPITLQEARQRNIRPYFNKIDPRDLFAWRTEYDGTKENLTEIRWKERSVEEYDEWSETEVLRIRVIRQDSWKTFVYRASEASVEYQPEDEGNFDFGEIPLVTIYAKKEAPLVAYPPLEDLAWLNLRHWQSSSDQNNILHVVRVPLLFGKGFQEGELDGLEIGANRAVTTTNDAADMKYIEHTGQAISAGRTDLKDLEERMGQMGSDILLQRSVSRQTAVARKIDQAESMSIFQVILRNTEAALEQAIRLAGKWQGIDVGEDLHVIIGDDLSVPGSESNIIENLNRMRDKGVLTNEEFYAEMVRRGNFSDTVENKGEGEILTDAEMTQKAQPPVQVVEKEDETDEDQ